MPDCLGITTLCASTLVVFSASAAIAAPAESSPGSAHQTPVLMAQLQSGTTTNMTNQGDQAPAQAGPWQGGPPPQGQGPGPAQGQWNQPPGGAWQDNRPSTPWPATGQSAQWQPLSQPPKYRKGQNPDTASGGPYRGGTEEGALGAGGMIVTTTEGVDGFHVRKYLGVIRGVRVFQPTIGESFKASFKGIIGGNIGSYVEMCEKARSQAYDQLLERATSLGANAVVGFRFDSSAFSLNQSEMGTEVICYGTAVFLDPNR